MSIAVKDANNVTQNIETVTDNAGNLVPVHTFEGQKASYRATATALVTVTGATDVMIINGSASKTIRVTRVSVEGTFAAAAMADISLIKRSTANTGGTSSATTVVPLDSAFAAGTAVVLQYTANPTTGTAVGAIAAAKYFGPTAPAATSRLEFKFGDNNASTCVLRGTAQGLAVSFNTGPAQAGSFDIHIEWTEE